MCKQMRSIQFMRLVNRRTCTYNQLIYIETTIFRLKSSFALAYTLKHGLKHSLGTEIDDLNCVCVCFFLRARTLKCDRRLVIAPRKW